MFKQQWLWNNEQIIVTDASLLHSACVHKVRIIRNAAKASAIALKVNVRNQIKSTGEHLPKQMLKNNLCCGYVMI